MLYNFNSLAIITLAGSLFLGGCSSVKNMQLGDSNSLNSHDLYKQKGACAAVSRKLEEEKETLGYKVSSYLGAKEDNSNAEGNISDDFDEDQLIKHLDYAILYAACGDAEKSIQSFNKATEIFQHFDNKAVVSVTEGGKGVGSILWNDNTLSYKGETYERVLARIYQAINYYNEKEYNDARIEINHAYTILDAEKLRVEDGYYDDLYEETSNKKSNVKWGDVNNNLKLQNDENDLIAARVNNSYENAFAYFISSIMDEQTKDIDSAYISLKRAHALLKNNPVILSNLIRVALQRGIPDDDLKRLQEDWKKITNTVWSNNLDPEKMGRIVIVINNGLAPEKSEFKLPIPLSNTVLFAAYPTLKSATRLHESFTAVASNGNKSSSSTMVDVAALAARNHQEKRPATIARLIARVTAKGIASDAIADQLGVLGSIGSTIFNYASESADLRSWKLLPASIDIIELYVKPGVTELMVFPVDSEENKIKIVVDIGPGKMKLIQLYAPSDKIRKTGGDSIPIPKVS